MKLASSMLPAAKEPLNCPAMSAAGGVVGLPTICRTAGLDVECLVGNHHPVIVGVVLSHRAAEDPPHVLGAGGLSKGHGKCCCRVDVGVCIET